MNMGKKYKILMVICAVLYVIYHLVTLIYSPLPWFDEVSFASITNSYLHHHTFYEEARIIVLPREKLDYGPVYFMIQAAVIRLIGFGIFNFRITGLLFGFADLYLVYELCRSFKFSVQATVVTILLIALEPNFNQFLHSGRMDFVTLFFFILSWLAFLKAGKGNMPALVLWSAITGVMLSCAVLTTPRIIFALSVYVCYFIYEIADIRHRDWKVVAIKYASVIAGFLVVYAIWVYGAFGSVGNFIYYYTHSAVIKEHTGMGPGLSIRYNLLIYLYAFAGFFILLANKGVKKNMELVLFTVPAIAAFLLIVTGGMSGRYFALVMPFAAILITATTLQLYNYKALKTITYLIPVLFAIVFLLKGVYIFATMKQHDPYRGEAVISKYIQPNSLVAGEFRNYYIVRDNNCSFLSIQENGYWYDMMKYMLDHKVNYFVVSREEPYKKAYDTMLAHHNYEKVVDLDMDMGDTFFNEINSFKICACCQ